MCVLAAGAEKFASSATFIIECLFCVACFCTLFLISLRSSEPQPKRRPHLCPLPPLLATLQNQRAVVERSKKNQTEEEENSRKKLEVKKEVEVFVRV